MSMAETKTTPQTAKAFSINGLLKHDAVLKVVKNTSDIVSNEAFAKLLESIAEKPVALSAEANTSVIKVEKTNTSIAKADVPVVETIPLPQVTKTAKDLKKQNEDEWRREKNKRRQNAVNLHKKLTGR